MHQHFHKHWRPNVEMDEIFANTFLRSFGLSMVGLFVPLFFMERGIPLGTVLLSYYGVFYTTSLIANFFSSRLLRRAGIKHTMALSVPFVVSQLILLQFFDTYRSSLVLLGFLGGIALSLYWMGLHTDFALAADRKKEGTETGMMFAFIHLAGMVGPLLGGFIIVKYGFHTLFLAAIAMIALSIVPLMRTKEMRKPKKGSVSRFMKAENLRFAFRFFVQGFLIVVDGIMWPVFIFITLGSFVDVGAAGSISILGTAVFSLFLGKVVDGVGSRKVLRMVALPLALVHYFMPAATMVAAIFALSLLNGFVTVGADLPIYRSFARYARKKDAVGYTLFRETMIGIGRLTAILIAALAIDKAGVSFYLGALVSLLLAL